ncbi:MAG: HNH endonuclease [Anaerolineales bacterium]|nr:MAG: HNH endonuclease [Anaerolineales bacterium]
MAQITVSPLPMNELDSALHALEQAVSQNRGREYCLRLWSTFIRLRDKKRCVLCGHSQGYLFAHHIVRKSFWKHGQYQTGNGITLCQTCHKEPHAGFNRRPDLNLPMDAQGGEKIDLLTGLLHALIIDAHQRGTFKEEYYRFDEQALQTFKSLQSIPTETQFEGSSLEQAYTIWNQTPRGMLKAILGTMGITLPKNFVQKDQITTFQSESNESALFVRYIPTALFRNDSNEDDDE